jgi:hypothetical protein
MTPSQEDTGNLQGAAYFAKNCTATSDEGFVNLAKRNFHLTGSHPVNEFAVGVEDFPAADRDGQRRDTESLNAGAYGSLLKQKGSQ